MTNTFTRTVTLSVTPASPETLLADETVAALIDNALQRLQDAVGSLISQGLLSGTLTYQEHTPAVNLAWTIKVADSPPKPQ